MSENVIDLGPHSNMTPEETLAVCAREKWSQIMVMGYHDGDDDLVIRSSHMTRAEALWIVATGKLVIMRIV